MFDFRRITLFCLGHCLSKHKMTVSSKNFGGWPPSPPLRLLLLRTTCIKNVKIKIIKIRRDCQYAGFFFYNENLNWAAEMLPLDRMRAAD